MKLVLALTSLLGSLAAVAAAPIVDPNQPQEQINFAVEYHLEEFPEVTARDVAELKNGQSVSVLYTATNHEELPVSVVGVGGSFRDPTNNNIKSNLTAGALGPFVLESGQSETFKQNIPLNLIPDNYLFTPELYIAYDDQLKSIPLRGQLAIVKDVPISFFNPQLLFLEIVLGGTIAGVLYLVYQIWGKSYLFGIAPVAPKVKKTASGTTVVDNTSWLPEVHTKQRKTKKVD